MDFFPRVSLPLLPTLLVVTSLVNNAAYGNIQVTVGKFFDRLLELGNGAGTGGTPRARPGDSAFRPRPRAYGASSELQRGIPCSAGRTGLPGRVLRFPSGKEPDLPRPATGGGPHVQGNLRRACLEFHVQSGGPAHRRFLPGLPCPDDHDRLHPSGAASYSGDFFGLPAPHHYRLQPETPAGFHGPAGPAGKAYRRA